MTVIDYSALTDPVPPDALAKFRQASKGTATFASIVARVLPYVFAVIFLAIFAMVLFTFVSIDGGFGDGAVIWIVAIAGFAIFCIVRILKRKTDVTRWWRLTRFAEVNGLLFERNMGEPSYPGAIFGKGKSRTLSEHVYRIGDDFLDFGNYRYTTGSGKNKSVHRWSYLAIKLDRMLPQMILDSKANNFIGSNLPVSFSRNQVLSLEGSFDDYFTLYCPRQYERDALYVFTPDLMARLVDEAADLDVEIVDDWMLFYTQKQFDLADPQVVAGIFRIADTVGEKTLHQTDRYADSRVAGSDGASLAAAGAPLGSRLANNEVASQGRRLKRGLSVGAVVLVVGMIGVWALVFFSNLLAF